MSLTKLFSAAVAGCALAAGTIATAQRASTLPVDATTSHKGEEYLLIGDAVRGAGEPVIAINPKDPDNIIVGAMTNLHFVEGSPFGTTEKTVAPRPSSRTATRRKRRSRDTRSRTTGAERGA